MAQENETIELAQEKKVSQILNQCQPLKKLNRFLPMDKEKLLIKSWVNCLGV
ncbi:MAG: hypothetical protein KKE98_00195 [Nanoarchaeota archaeon]|nr:hypothetical protein [Nanoarchaeota archaeon]